MPIDSITGEINELSAPILVKTVFLDKANHSTISQALIQCCSDYQVDFSKVFLFVSDSASYMIKAWNVILSALWINCTHMHCHAHIVALAGNSFRLRLNNVDRAVALLKSVLVKAPSRRSRFLRHLLSCGVNSPTIPPEPVVTRWNSWFQSVAYHAPLLQHYSSFVASEREQETDTEALKELSTILQSEVIVQQFSYIANHCTRLIHVLDAWQSRTAQIQHVYNTMQDLISWLTDLANSTSDEICSQAARSAASKLQDYTKISKQPAISLLRSIRALDPKQLPTLDVSYPTIKVDLHFPDTCDPEWPIYLAFAKEIGNSSPNPIAFWIASQKRVTNLASHAVLLLQLLNNSADVERSFSAFNQISTAQRQRITENNLAGLLKLHFNKL